ncbi:MAG: enoyl-CoA hydratase-related protein [Solirubrobacterales bacterium]
MASTGQDTNGHAATAGAVLSELRDGVAWVTLNRPDVLNAMDEALMDGLLAALEEAAADESVRCVAVRGAGRAFCAGGDLKMMARRREQARLDGDSDGASLHRTAQELAHRGRASVLLQTMSKPTVAVLHGHVVGGAVGLALGADVRIAARGTSLRIGFASIGLSGDYGLAYLLERSLGMARARELVLLDPVLDADEALAMGLLTRVVEPEELADAAAELAGRLAAGPTVAYARMKMNLLAAQAAHRLADVLPEEALNQRVSATTADAREAGRARAESRPPEFRGG